jgi:hypothetical protein
MRTYCACVMGGIALVLAGGVPAQATGQGDDVPEFRVVGARTAEEPRHAPVVHCSLELQIRQPVHEVEPPLPSGTILPDAVGIIDLRRVRSDSAAASVRNPWVENEPEDSPRAELELSCGAIVRPSGGEARALLNGGWVIEGGKVGPFTVVRVASSGVVLESAGLPFLVPRSGKARVMAP